MQQNHSTISRHWINSRSKNIASSPEKESQPYVGELSEKIRLILNTQLKDIPFSSKNGAIAVLEKIGIMTVGDLCSRHRSEIEAIPSIRSRMNFVDKILSDLGLTYGMKI